MKKFWMSVKTSWPIWGAFAAFFLLIGSMVAFSADWDRSFPLDYGPPGDTRTEMLNKLDEQADETFVHLNTLKANFAGDTAPTNPSQGQVWYDTINSTLKVFEASTWISAYSYSSAEFTWLGELADTASFATTQLNAVSATIGNLEASTISAPYATLTDIDVVSAEIGSATVGTLTTANWSQSSATFNTLVVTGDTDLGLKRVLLYRNDSITFTDPTVNTGFVWDQSKIDVGGWWAGGKNITVPSGVELIQCAAQMDARLTTLVTSGEFVLILEKNDSSIYAGKAHITELHMEDVIINTGSDNYFQLITPFYEVTAGQTFGFVLYWDSNGPSLTIRGDSNTYANLTWFSCWEIAH